MSRPITGFIALAVLVLGALSAHAQEVPGCGELRNAFGPFDYRDPKAQGEPLTLVHAGHFNRDVEALVRGKTGPVIGDLDYTLRAFPNHHRALNSVAQYGLRGGRFTNENIPSCECYFQRAIAFAPDDEVVRAIYGNYLFKSKAIKEAKAQYEEALKLAPASAEINYNAGLFYLAIGDLPRARELAKVAYDQGYPLEGLKNKIEAAEAAAAKPTVSSKR